MIEPQPLNEITLATDRTSPWTSVLSDSDLGSLMNLEVTEAPLWHCASVMEEKEGSGVVSKPAAPMQPSNSPPAGGDSDLSDGFESVEDEEAARCVPSVCEEHGEEQEPFASGSTKDTKQRKSCGQRDTSDSEDDSSLPSSTVSSPKANRDKTNDFKAKAYPFCCA